MVRDRDVEKNICVILQHRMLDCYQTNMQGFYERRDEADDPCRDLKVRLVSIVQSCFYTQVTNLKGVANTVFMHALVQSIK